jgi:hypothetical protein
MKVGEEETIPYDAIGTLANDIQKLIVTADGSKIAYAGVCNVVHVHVEKTKGMGDTIAVGEYFGNPSKAQTLRQLGATACLFRRRHLPFRPCCSAFLPSPMYQTRR